jgi:hypothetical protein
MSLQDYPRNPFLGNGIWNIIQHGKAKLSDAERELYLIYCFLEKTWISKPSDFDEIDPEVKHGLITILEMESKKIEKEENKMKAEEALNKLKGRSAL